MACALLRIPGRRRIGQGARSPGARRIGGGGVCCAAPRRKDFCPQPLDTGLPVVLRYRNAVVPGAPEQSAAILPRFLYRAKSATLWHEFVPAPTAVLVLHSGVAVDHAAVDDFCDRGHG